MEYQNSRDMLWSCSGLSDWARRFLGGLAAVAAFAFAGPVSAVSLDFMCITGNDSGDCAIGESQLTVDVTDPGGNQVNFRFNNSGSADSAITEVYFDDGELLGIADVSHSAGDSWTAGDASPPDLPGGDSITPKFEVTGYFKAESDPPPPKKGVNPGEWLDVVFDLKTGKTFNDIIADLISGDLRVGMHVIAFDSGGSESFVNDPDQVIPPSAIPVPAAVWLFGSGLLGLVGIARRRY
ncbi:hypothetical protein TspCOW1_27480 [Thiohalobacter sp. COW1]|uniref:VPLPA-CTERM sorting domain-containing protein n=1 Tax=Thiohalobacter thiocyanaticus TaxID=585455 RepID=A0A1Z4VUV5_9GAMM|nr:MULTISPECIES: VPLPA-CTERM sorting domain-containing protein [Thiohalobacter]BAZ95406.1 uncharacterized protein FOKN1_3049 [Thiohalobacter thiocyanaticus]BCO32645.1 hypothetical protein TspCOW1_27480 [Thiohalobacter sp. COW1]